MTGWWGRIESDPPDPEAEEPPEEEPLDEPEPEYASPPLSSFPSRL